MESLIILLLVFDVVLYVIGSVLEWFADAIHHGWNLGMRGVLNYEMADWFSCGHPN